MKTSSSHDASLQNLLSAHPLLFTFPAPSPSIFYLSTNSPFSSIVPQTIIMHTVIVPSLYTITPLFVPPCSCYVYPVVPQYSNYVLCVPFPPPFIVPPLCQWKKKKNSPKFVPTKLGWDSSIPCCALPSAGRAMQWCHHTVESSRHLGPHEISDTYVSIFWRQNHPRCECSLSVLLGGGRGVWTKTGIFVAQGPIRGFSSSPSFDAKFWCQIHRTPLEVLWSPCLDGSELFWQHEGDPHNIRHVVLI